MEPRKVHNLVKNTWNHCEDIYGQLYTKLDTRSQPLVRLNSMPQNSGPSYDEYLKDHLQQVPGFSPSTIDPRIITITDSLNYIPMSKDMADIHKKMYIFAQQQQKIPFDIESLFTSNTEVTINSSKKFANKLFKFWIGKAKTLSKYKQLKPPEQWKAVQLSRFIILGKPGTGKTAFINYLFSVNANEMLRTKVFWVRVNLNDIQNTNLQLIDRLYSKFLKTFSHFYLFKTPSFNEEFLDRLATSLLDLTTQLKTFRGLTDDQKLNLINTYTDILVSLHDDKKMRLNSPDAWINEGIEPKYARKLTEHLIAYIQTEYGYSYIFIFDGLDSVTIDYVRYDIYRQWINDIAIVAKTEINPYKAMYIVTMRDYSYINLFERHLKAARSDLDMFQICRITEKPLKSILKKRYDYALKRLNTDGYTCNEHHLKNMNCNIMKLISTLLNKANNKKGDDFYYEHFLRLNNDNIRSALRFLRELLFMIASYMKDDAFSILTSDPKTNNLLNFFIRKEWILYRIFLYGGFSFVTYHNRVSYNEHGALVINSRNKSIIPNIFNFKEIECNSEACHPTKILFKMRLIQMLANEHSHGARINDVFNKLREHFGYTHKDKDLRYETREMIYNGLLNPITSEKDLLYAETERKNYVIRHSELANFIITNMLKASIYFETVCEDTPIPSSLCGKIIPISKYEEGIKMGEYLRKKTKSLIYFILYLMHIEDKEREHFNHFRNKPLDSYDICKYRIFDATAKVALIEDIAKYIGGYIKAEGPSIIPEFINEWCREFEISNKGDLFNE